jgi:hypothetical protein
MISAAKQARQLPAVQKVFIDIGFPWPFGIFEVISSGLLINRFTIVPFVTTYRKSLIWQLRPAIRILFIDKARKSKKLGLPTGSREGSKGWVAPPCAALEAVGAPLLATKL